MIETTSNPRRVLSAFQKSVLIVGSISCVTLLFVACTDSSNKRDAGPDSTSTKTALATKDLTDPELIKRGDYLVSTMGCDDCHSSKKMRPKGPEIIAETRFGGFISTTKLPKIDTNQIRSGWVLLTGDLTTAVGPWGQTFAANISSDSTGIGNWKEEQFFKAIREGKLKGLEGTRPILPPMPWFNYARLNDEDLRAIFAFLKSTKPVNNVVPDAKPPHLLN